MSKTQLFLLSLIVCLPLALLAWLGSRLARGERTLVRQQLQVLLTDQLAETNRAIAHRLTSLQAELLATTNLPSLRPDDLRGVVRTNPLISQLFVLDADGHLLHPSPDLPLNQAEREFLNRSKTFLLDRDLVRLASQHESPSATESGDSHATANSSRDTHGWYVWYWGRGLHLIFWRRRADGQIVGIDVERSRWIAELISVLPETQLATDPSPTQNCCRCCTSIQGRY